MLFLLGEIRLCLINAVLLEVGLCYKKCSSHILKACFSVPLPKSKDNLFVCLFCFSPYNLVGFLEINLMKMWVTPQEYRRKHQDFPTVKLIHI